MRRWIRSGSPHQCSPAAPPTDAQLAAAVALQFQTVLKRAPTAEERRTLGDYVTAHGLPAACRVVLNLNEFVFAD